MRRSRQRGENGSAVVDYVMVSVLLLPLVLGVLQLALVMHVRNTLTSVAGEAARYAAVSGSSAAAGEAKANQMLAVGLSSGFAREVDVRAETVAGTAGFESVIQAQVPVLGIGGPAIALRVTGHAVAEQQ